MPYYPEDRPSTAPGNVCIASEYPANEEEFESLDQLISPGHDSLFSGPTTPNNVVFGEACLVDVQSPGQPDKRVRKVMSADRLYPGTPAAPDTSLRSRTLHHTKSAQHLSAKPALTQKGDTSSMYLQLPRTIFMKASQTTIKKHQSASPISASDISRVMFSYVDRGTDAEEIPKEEPSSNENENFEPVFPAVEDLVIYFASGTLSKVLESIYYSNKDGNYPVARSLPDFCNFECSPSSTISTHSTDGLLSVSPDGPEANNGIHHSSREFDPYSFNISPWSEQHELPTPSITPPSSTDGPEKYIRFSPAKADSVIAIQNSLRMLFNSQFPPQQGYTQHCFPVAPEADRLWKPVLSNDPYASRKEDRTVDQIIALGCENGVKKDFFALISGQVERLGMKRDGLNRSGKLDLRYPFLSLFPHTTS